MLKFGGPRTSAAHLWQWRALARLAAPEHRQARPPDTCESGSPPCRLRRRALLLLTWPGRRPMLLSLGLLPAAPTGKVNSTAR